MKRRRERGGGGQSGKIEEVKANGKRVAVRKGARLRSVVNLTKLPKGRFRVDITMKLVDGRAVKGTRTYRTCAVKRRAGRGSRV